MYYIICVKITVLKKKNLEKYKNDDTNDLG